jgi:Tat protein translocase TatB subunit
MNFLGMGPFELLMILGLALVVFGPGKLPELARQVGRTVGELRRMSSEVTREIQKSIDIEGETAGRQPTIRHQPPSPLPPPPATRPTPSEKSDVLPPY